MTKRFVHIRRIKYKSYPQYSGEFTTYAPIPRGIMDEGCKAFGYELMDIKLGGVSARLKACQRRIASYLSKEVDKLEELEQERLSYWTVENKYPHDMKVELRENIWSRIVSGCDLIDTI